MQTIDYSGATNLGSAMGLVNYSVPGILTNATNSFVFDLVYGSKVNSPNTNQIRAFLFEERDNRYLFKLGVIPQQKGIYGIGFSDAQKQDFQSILKILISTII